MHYTANKVQTYVRVLIPLFRAVKICTLSAYNNIDEKSVFATLIIGPSFLEFKCLLMISIARHGGAILGEALAPKTQIFTKIIICLRDAETIVSRSQFLKAFLPKFE